MKNNKGITLTSLVIYIAVIFVVLAALMRITIHFRNNMVEVAEVGFETEFNKINLYMLDESKKTGNTIIKISEEGKRIRFESGNKYFYNEEEQIIYLNDKIKICENVEMCLFEQRKAENGKNTLVLTIKIGEDERIAKYVMGEYKNTTLLPKEYQEVEYIESTGKQYIDTNFIPSGKELRIITSFEYVRDHNRLSLFGNNSSVPYYLTVYGSVPLFYVGSSSAISCGKQTALNTKYILDVEVKDGVITAKWDGEESTATYTGNLNTQNEYYIFGSNANGSLAESDSGYRLFSFKIYDDDTLVRDYIPCYRKSDNVIGLYDLVNNEFYENAGTEVFLKGDDKNTIVASEKEDFINEEDYTFNMETKIPLLPAEYQQDVD